MTARSRVSCFFEGTVEHRRFTPTEHRFSYRTYMAYLDLDELPTLFDDAWSWGVDSPGITTFQRRDYLAPRDVPLDVAVRDCVEAASGTRPDGPIRLLTQLRSFGTSFNPVSFYYCFSADGEELEFVVAEITNTPWNERHRYVLDRRGGGDAPRFIFDKRFHVSPFMPMELEYRWFFTPPDDHLVVHMENFRDEEKCFHATLALSRTEITRRSRLRITWQYPFTAALVWAAIHWQALRLWQKRLTFHDHPQGLRRGSDAAVRATRLRPPEEVRSAESNPTAAIESQTSEPHVSRLQSSGSSSSTSSAV